ncbi:hypothetical protein [uncultured Muribaculum sp.]|uniref:hypothetical protein n=1 Tax=uncultured Muribaculum sp. TaxID=1918613 RepID=UPI002675FC26|nr:hypothetical protein [uncultured Muribaculum sp.]
MKKKIVFIAAVTMLWSCSQSGKESTDYVTYEDAEAEFAATLSAGDTTEVLSAGSAVMDSLRAGNIDYALSQLRAADTNGNVADLSDEQRARLRARFERFPVVEWEIDYYDFSLPGLNDLKYRTYMRARDGKSGVPAMSLMLNPVKKDGKWYLCVKDAELPAKDAANAINPKQIIGER